MIASFAAVKLLIDLGASQGFFTLMSRTTRGRSFILSYVVWQVFQFVFIVFILGVLLPKEWIDYIGFGLYSVPRREEIRALTDIDLAKGILDHAKS